MLKIVVGILNNIKIKMALTKVQNILMFINQMKNTVFIQVFAEMKLKTYRTKMFRNSFWRSLPVN